MMPRQNIDMNLIPGKIRKRGCSSSASSSSSILQNYRFKRAVHVGKRGGSYTPVPTWKLLSSRLRSPASALRTMDSPASQYSGGKSNQAPVSARKLAATLWEINEIPLMEEDLELDRGKLKKECRGRERVPRSAHSGSLPPHLSDPSHSPVSERIDRSATGSRCRGTPSISQILKRRDHNVGVADYVSKASVVGVETRSRAQIPNASVIGTKTRLKDISNALTTSKELLKIIHRMWGQEDRSSSSISLISALHAELERGRLQVNQLIQDQRSDQNGMNYLMKCFEEEKAVWKNKEKDAVESAIESISRELEVERKLRRRFESFNKKLGRELAETKSSFLKLVKEHESEKRAREIIEQVCQELARGIENEVVVRELEEVVNNEREAMHITNLLSREKADIIAGDNVVDEKSAAVDKLRNQLEAALGSKRSKQKEHEPKYPNIAEITGYVGRNLPSLHQNEELEDGEVDNRSECLEDSAESELHSVELNLGNNPNSYCWVNPSGIASNRRRSSVTEEPKARKSVSGKITRKSTSLERSISDGVEWGVEAEKYLVSGDKFEERKFYADELQVHNKSSKSLRDIVLSGTRLGCSKTNGGPSRQWGQAWPSRDSTAAAHERPPTGQGGGSKSRLMEATGNGLNSRIKKSGLKL